MSVAMWLHVVRPLAVSTVGCSERQTIDFGQAYTHVYVFTLFNVRAFPQLLG
jgi:hypothetical protein